MTFNRKRLGEPPRTRTVNRLIKSQLDTMAMVNKMGVSALAQLTNFSKSFISQVKAGKKPAPGFR
jgi:hypothetical protein